VTDSDNEENSRVPVDPTKWPTRREKIILETYTTELSYVRSLRLALALYRRPVQLLILKSFPQALSIPSTASTATTSSSNFGTSPNNSSSSSLTSSSIGSLTASVLFSATNSNTAQQSPLSQFTESIIDYASLATAPFYTDSDPLIRIDRLFKSMANILNVNSILLNSLRERYKKTQTRTVRRENEGRKRRKGGSLKRGKEEKKKQKKQERRNQY
jgi:hypothetical protein